MSQHASISLQGNYEKIISICADLLELHGETGLQGWLTFQELCTHIVSLFKDTLVWLGWLESRQNVARFSLSSLRYISAAVHVALASWEEVPNIYQSVVINRQLCVHGNTHTHILEWVETTECLNWQSIGVFWLHILLCSKLSEIVKKLQFWDFKSYFVYNPSVQFSVRVESKTCIE